MVFYGLGPHGEIEEEVVIERVGRLFGTMPKSEETP